jgi:hypothetical protein
LRRNPLQRRRSDCSACSLAANKYPAACPQHTLFFERSAMSLRTRKLGPTQRPSRGSRENGVLSNFDPGRLPTANLPKTGTFQVLRR